jgi:hypothetical protein
MVVPVIAEPPLKTPPESVTEDLESLSALGFNVEEYLLTIFPKGGYTLFPKPIKAGNHILWCAARYIKNAPKVFDKAIIFEVTGGVPHRYLLVKNFMFMNEDNSVFFDFSPRDYPGIYGFDFSLGRRDHISVDAFFDGGYRPADSFIMAWDEERKQFKDWSPQDDG